MTGGKASNRDALDRLTDALVEDVLSASDEDLVAELIEDGVDPAAFAARARGCFEAAAATSAKARLAAARAAVDADRQRVATVTRLNSAEARRRLERALSRNPDAQRGLTLAARKGDSLSDEDVLGMLEDLEELGLTGPADQDGDL